MQKTLQALANELWDTYCEVWPELVRYDCPTIVLNKRTTKTAGQAHFEENNLMLSYKHLEQHWEHMVGEIMPHELVHFADWHINGWYDRKPHHGKLWYDMMLRIGKAPNAFHRMELV